MTILLLFISSYSHTSRSETYTSRSETHTSRSETYTSRSETYTSRSETYTIRSETYMSRSESSSSPGSMLYCDSDDDDLLLATPVVALVSAFCDMLTVSSTICRRLS